MDGEPSDLLTLDKENIEVNTWARWRVTDPKLFFVAVETETYTGFRWRRCVREDVIPQKNRWRHFETKNGSSSTPQKNSQG